MHVAVWTIGYTLCLVLLKDTTEMPAYLPMSGSSTMPSDTRLHQQLNSRKQSDVVGKDMEHPNGTDVVLSSTTPTNYSTDFNYVNYGTTDSKNNHYDAKYLETTMNSNSDVNMTTYLNTDTKVTIRSNNSMNKFDLNLNSNSYTNESNNQNTHTIRASMIGRNVSKMSTIVIPPVLSNFEPVSNGTYRLIIGFLPAGANDTKYGRNKPQSANTSYLIPILFSRYAKNPNRFSTILLNRNTIHTTVSQPTNEPGTMSNDSYRIPSVRTRTETYPHRLPTMTILSESNPRTPLPFSLRNVKKPEGILSIRTVSPKTVNDRYDTQTLPPKIVDTQTLSPDIIDTQTLSTDNSVSSSAKEPNTLPTTLSPSPHTLYPIPPESVLYRYKSPTNPSIPSTYHGLFPMVFHPIMNPMFQSPYVPHMFPNTFPSRYESRYPMYQPNYHYKPAISPHQSLNSNRWSSTTTPSIHTIQRTTTTVSTRTTTTMYVILVQSAKPPGAGLTQQYVPPTNHQAQPFNYQHRLPTRPTVYQIVPANHRVTPINRSPPVRRPLTISHQVEVAPQGYRRLGQNVNSAPNYATMSQHIPPHYIQSQPYRVAPIKQSPQNNHRLGQSVKSAPHYATIQPQHTPPHYIQPPRQRPWMYHSRYGTPITTGWYRKFRYHPLPTVENPSTPRSVLSPKRIYIDKGDRKLTSLHPSPDTTSSVGFPTIDVPLPLPLPPPPQLPVPQQSHPPQPQQQFSFQTTMIPYKYPHRRQPWPRYRYPVYHRPVAPHQAQYKPVSSYQHRPVSPYKPISVGPARVYQRPFHQIPVPRTPQAHTISADRPSDTQTDIAVDPPVPTEPQPHLPPPQPHPPPRPQSIFQRQAHPPLQHIYPQPHQGYRPYHPYHPGYLMYPYHSLPPTNEPWLVTHPFRPTRITTTDPNRDVEVSEIAQLLMAHY